MKRTKHSAPVGLFVLALTILAWPAGAAHADEPTETWSDEWSDAKLPATQREKQSATTKLEGHLGLNFRADFGTHPLRIDGGIRSGRYDFILVIDPMFWTDGQHDIDLLVDRRFGETGWSAFAGWRTTAIAITGGIHWQHKSVVGVAARLAPLLGGRFRASAGFEFTTLWVKHGDGLPTETIRADRSIIDSLNIGLFLRMEVATPL